MDTWSEAAGTSWCASRACEGSVAEVAALLESYAAGQARFSIPGGLLALRGDAGSAPGITAVSPRRVQAARVRWAWWRPSTRVTVEVDRWSPAASEIVIRPRRRTAPGDAYLRAVAGLVDVLVCELELDRIQSGATAPAPRAGLRRAS